MMQMPSSSPWLTLAIILCIGIVLCNAPRSDGPLYWNENTNQTDKCPAACYECRKTNLLKRPYWLSLCPKLWSKGFCALSDCISAPSAAPSTASPISTASPLDLTTSSSTVADSTNATKSYLMSVTTTSVESFNDKSGCDATEFHKHIQRLYSAVFVLAFCLSLTVFALVYVMRRQNNTQAYRRVEAEEPSSDSNKIDGEINQSNPINEIATRPDQANEVQSSAQPSPARSTIGPPMVIEMEENFVLNIIPGREPITADEDDQI